MAKVLRFESEQFFDRSRRQIVVIVVLFRVAREAGDIGIVELAEAVGDHSAGDEELEALGEARIVAEMQSFAVLEFWMWAAFSRTAE
ncbi:MAG: hypothetical protein V3T72_12870 [Thermoanaerobaculia bacterium]